MKFHVGDQVTVEPVDTDPYILQFQRYATVAARNDLGYTVRLTDFRPSDYGPIPESRLLPGWRDANGRWR